MSSQQPDTLSKNPNKIASMFNSISSTYDFLNHFLSFGLDRYWRKKIIKNIPLEQNNMKLLDMATGTGDVLFELALFSSKYSAKRGNKIIFEEMYGIDIASSMLDISKKKIRKYSYLPTIFFEEGDAHSLRFEDNFFDIITVAFGVRNMENLDKVFQESFRVLTPHGKLIILELSIPENFIFKHLYLFYFRFILPVVAGIISKNFKAYSYLNKSVESFYHHTEISKMLKKRDFKDVQVKKFGFGIYTLYVISK